MRARLLVALGPAIFLAPGSSALAAPPWAEPRAIGAAAPLLSRATIAFAPDGTALLSRRFPPTGGQSPSDQDHLATVAPDGTLVEHAPRRRLAAPPLVFGRGRVAALSERLVSGPNARVRRVQIRLSVGTMRRPLPERQRRLATYAPVPSDSTAGPALAAGPNGELAIAWMEYRGDEFASGRFRVRLAVRRANGRFRRTRTVAGGHVEGNRESHSVAVAYGAGRDVIVAFARDPRRADERSIGVRTLRRGRRFDREQNLGPHLGLVGLELAAARSGRAIVAWATQDGGEEANLPAVVRAASRAPGARRFAATRTLDTAEVVDRLPGRLALAMAPDGSAVLAWSTIRGRRPAIDYPVRAALAEPGSELGPASDLAAEGAVADAAARADGALLVSWTDVHDFTLAGPRESLAALRPGPGQPFGPAELIAPSSPGLGFDRGLATAFDPRTGRPSAAWIATNPGADQLQLSTRTG